MNGFLAQIFQPGPSQNVPGQVIGFILSILLEPVTALVGLYLIYFLLTLPLRRNERAQVFLDLIHLGLNSGRSAETTIAEVAASGDPMLGSRFQQLAGCLAQGLSMEQALERVPRLLPPQVHAMLVVGKRVGDLAKVLPACRLSLQGGISQVRGALNYLLVLCFMATPFTILVPLVLKLKVLPAFLSIFAGTFDGATLPVFTRFVLGAGSYLIALQVGVMLLVWILTVSYLGGARFRAWAGRVLPGGASLVDWILSLLPWRWRRLQRDFSAMLAALLESGVPEAEAVRLAGEATANTRFQYRAQLAAARLAEGITLPVALRALDDTGELQWRLANALHSQRGFVRTLAGWHEALEAKAFQLEQTAAQTATALVVLLNGFVVACIMIGMFLPLIYLLNRMTLW